MSAEPVRHEDPHDPTVILRDLPERERAEFLSQYHSAVDNAHDPAGYQQLQRMLHVWSLVVVATNRAGYYEEIAAVRGGTVRTVSASAVIPDWPERATAAKGRQHDLSRSVQPSSTEADGWFS